MDTQDLVREAKQGSSAAQRCLFDRYAPGLLILCRRYVKIPEDAEDLMLTGFHKFFQQLPEFKYQGELELRAWLKRTMINECLMFMRKKKLFIIVTETESDLVAVAEVAFNNMTATEIFTLIVHLPTGYRTVFNLYVVEGYSHHEIARMLDISEGTSRSQLSKAKTMLQKLLLKNEFEYGNRKTR